MESEAKAFESRKGQRLCRRTFTIMLLVVPSILFLCFPAAAYLRAGNAFPFVVGLILTLIAFALYIFAAISDPGRIPPNLGKTKAKAPPRVAQMTSGAGKAHELVYCKVCNIYRPPRCAHCYDCNACVEVLDHHCVWLENCVGKRNYNTFLYFVITVFTHAAFVATVSSLALSYGLSGVTNTVSMLVLIFVVLAGLLVGSLCGFHLWLIAQGMTTHEHLKKTFPDGSPHSKGMYRNCLSVCCSLPQTRRKFDHDKEALENQNNTLSKVRYVDGSTMEQMTQSSDANPALDSQPEGGAEGGADPGGGPGLESTPEEEHVGSDASTTDASTGPKGVNSRSSVVRQSAVSLL